MTEVRRRTGTDASPEDRLVSVLFTTVVGSLTGCTLYRRVWIINASAHRPNTNTKVNTKPIANSNQNPSPNRNGVQNSDPGHFGVRT